MDFYKINLYIHTVIQLKPIQVYYRLYYLFRNLFFNSEAEQKNDLQINPIKWETKLPSISGYLIKTKSFNFLNIPHYFLDQIDWDYAEHGKLWRYNLNYFDFLNQAEMPKKIGLELIKDYIKNDKTLKDGKEPYPISLRGINWIKFLTENKINDTEINEKLYYHYIILLKNLEFHLLGNHLLENAFSLLFGAYYFQDNNLYNKSRKLLISELNEQILKDGGHFELSPMYHQIIFLRLLDCIHLIKQNKFWKENDLLSFLEAKAALMYSWLQKITYQNGEIPMLNDATFNIAPKSKKLFSYAEKLGIVKQDVPLSESGYRKISINNYELLLDVGNIGPSYQPGHAHSDTFNFELIKSGKPIFVDTGITTYEKNLKRQKERSTHSHNTVKIGNKEQSQVWGGFRVAKRAKIIHLNEKPNFIEASHNGYKSEGFIHKRSYLWDEKNLIISDNLYKSTRNSARAFFHLHSSLEKPFVKKNRVIINSSGLLIDFENALNIEIDDYQLSEGFNKSKMAYKIIVIFDQTLKTKISL